MSLVVSDEGRVRTLRIDREDKLGALSTGIVTALGDEFAALDGSRNIRVVIITGTGRGFIAGADIEEYSNATPEVFEEYQRFSRDVFESLAELPQATIAAVNGYAFGGGFEIALACDFILASPNARFGLPEITLGLVPGGGGIGRLADATSPRFAKELMMTGRPVAPPEALAHGILSEVTGDDDLLDRANALAAKLALRAPLAIRELKALMRDGGLTREREALTRLFASADGSEGIAAFIEKRQAEFRGE